MSTYARYQRISELFSVPQLRVASQALELGFITYFQGWFHSESQALFRLWQAVTCIIIITSPSPSPPFSQVTPFSLSLSPSRTHDSTHHSNTHRHPLRFKIQYSALAAGPIRAADVWPADASKLPCLECDFDIMENRVSYRRTGLATTSAFAILILGSA